MPSSGTKTPKALLDSEFTLLANTTNNPDSLGAGTELKLKFMDDALELSFFNNQGTRNQVLLSVTDYYTESNDLVLQLRYISHEGNEQRLRLSARQDDSPEGNFTMTNIPEALGFEEIGGTYTYTLSNHTPLPVL